MRRTRRRTAGSSTLRRARCGPAGSTRTTSRTRVPDFEGAGWPRAEGLVKRSAFTLVEMLVVIVILGIAGALVIPAMGSTGVLRVQGAVRTIVSDMTFMQADAVAFQEKRAMVFDVDNSSYRIVAIPGSAIDVANTLYKADGPNREYVVDLRPDADGPFGDSRIAAVDF